MVDFIEAMQWMGKGLKIRRKKWKNKNYYWYVDKSYAFDNLRCIREPSGMKTCIGKSCIEADDWEIFTKHPERILWGTDITGDIKIEVLGFVRNKIIIITKIKETKL